MEPLYRETQKFNQWWMWVMNLVVMGIMVFAGWMEYKSTGDLLTTYLGIMIGMLMIGMIAAVSLKTTITDDGIEVRFWPFMRRRIFRSEIVEARVRKYSPIGEYGGWGIKYGKSGKCYNTQGDMGLQLRLKDGKKVLIGTQRPEELAEFIEAYLADTNPGEDEALELRQLAEEKLKEKG